MAQIAPPRTTRAASVQSPSGQIPSSTATALLKFPVDLHFYFNVIEPVLEPNATQGTETLHMCTFGNALNAPKRKFFDGEKPLLKFLMNERFTGGMNALVRMYHLSDWSDAKQVGAAAMILIVEWANPDPESPNQEFWKEIQADDWAGLAQLLAGLDTERGTSPVRARVEITSHIRIDKRSASQFEVASSSNNLPIRADSVTTEDPNAGGGQTIADEFESLRAAFRARALGKAEDAGD